MDKPRLQERPTSEQIAALPPFEALSPARIHVLATAEQLVMAERALRAAVHVGFDTESKPVFTAGTVHTGPDVIQFATEDDAFIVQSATPGIAEFLRAMIESDDIVRVGFGLASDRPQLLRKFGLRLGRSLDLSFMIRQLGFKQAVGLKTAVAVVLGRHLQKSKKATTSNWANSTLTPQQLQYAANDAHASLLIYKALAEQASRGIGARPT